MDHTPSARPLSAHLLDVAPLSVAIVVFGVTFGILAVAAGVTVAQAAALSLLTFTGASQFAAVGVLAAGGTSVAAMTGALLLAARNSLYGVAVARLVPGSFRQRLVGAQLVIDETTAMATAQPTTADASRAFWVTGIAVGTAWNVGTLVGAIFGQVIVDPAALGLDVAFPAAFLALVAPQLRHRPGLVAALAGGLVAAVLIPFTAPGIPILAASVGVVPALFVARRRRSDGGLEGTS
jgi:4-azaleucine resistance transporter AzlC